MKIAALKGLKTIDPETDEVEIVLAGYKT